MINTRYQAVALCRVSTSKQRIYGNSLEAQEKRIIDAAGLLGVDLPDAYIWRRDVSSRKGKNIKRKDLLEIRDVCKRNKKIKFFIVDEPDRFMRSIEEFYWWKVELKQIGVELRFAHNPLASDSDQTHVFDELINVYRAESSNHERSTKANEKMQSRIDLGFYPGFCHIGYQKSDTKGIHIPKEPEFSLLQSAYSDIASGKSTLQQALAAMNDKGYAQKSGKKMDMMKFRKILKEPYYYGAVKMGKFTTNETGLHQAMITKEQYEIASKIAKGQRARFVVNRHNPDFTMNLLLCESCYVLRENKQGKFTGYEHHNGKELGQRKYYKRYRCRGCNMAFKRDELHEMISVYVDKVKLSQVARKSLTVSLRKAWLDTEKDNLAKVTRLRLKLGIAIKQKTALLMSMAENPDLKTDFQDAVVLKKEEIAIIESELDKAMNIESEFNEFVEFSLDFVDSLKDRWWELDHEDRLRCEELLFPQLLRITDKRKVSTPEISAIYRYGLNKKTPEGVLEYTSGGPGGT